MAFEKYQHVERWNHQECDGLLDGICHIFPKIDGTNASIWYDDYIRCGSRNRELTLDNDNAGFMKWAVDQANILEFFRAYPKLRLYGEWLVPHSLKTYEDSAWREFYVFDVVVEGLARDYEQYSSVLSQYGIKCIPPIRVIKRPTEENLLKCLEENTYLIKDGQGRGEGIVIKNYAFVNKYGRQVWGKMITNEFKTKHHEAMGAPLSNGTELVEEKIARDFLSDEFIAKEQSKIMLREGAPELDDDANPTGVIIPYWSNKMIPELLGRVWYEFLREETVTFVQKLKNPKINFQLLQKLVNNRTKEYLGL